MKLIRQTAELQAWLAQCRAQNQRVGLVPTMGNLHDGHIALLKMAQAHSTQSIVSIYVNPLQFGKTEDFDDYPRTLKADMARLSAAGCDVLFAPHTKDMYPDGLAQTPLIRAGAIGQELEGRARPIHFNGVLTLLNRLFLLCPADCAVFGQKDFQQQWIVRRFAAKAFPHITILTAPTHREASGLAMSSRNHYLSKAQKSQAVVISQSLQSCCAAIADGARGWAELEHTAMTRIAQAGLIPDYVAIRHTDNLGKPPANPRAGMSLVVLAAAKLDKTRLLDNYTVIT